MTQDRRGISVATVLWAVGIVSLGSTARAGLVDLNPTGSAASPVITIAGIDIGPGNALAVNSLQLVVDKTFQLDFQASVSGFTNVAGLSTTPTGLGTSYQITAVASFTEVVQSVSGGTATFALAPTQGSASFFELYYNNAVVANNLAGTGFNTGTLILAGKPATELGSVGVFTLSTSGGAPTVQPFDQFGTDHYPTVQSVVGSGSALVPADVTFADPKFFLSPVNNLSFNSSLVTAFKSTDPSGRFVGTANGGAADVVPNLGGANGLAGPDFQFQADANFSFNVSIPEPASFIQLGLGVLTALGFATGMKVAGRRRRAPAPG